MILFNEYPRRGSRGLRGLVDIWQLRRQLCESLKRLGHEMYLFFDDMH